MTNAGTAGRKFRCGIVLCLIALLPVLTSVVAASQPSDHPAVSCCPALDSDIWAVDSLAPGLTRFSHHFDDLFGAPQYVSVLAVDLGSSNVDVKIEAAQRLGQESMRASAFGEATGAVAVVNGGFMHGGAESANSGLVKVDGEVLPFLREEPEELRFVGSSAFGIDAYGRWHFRDREGDRWDDEWAEVEYALAGGHSLVRDGTVTATIENEHFRSDVEINHSARRHPRTAVCLTSDSTAVLATVDGRHDEAAGLSLKELSQLLLAFGCRDAINLDGGGSTTMWTAKEGVVNHPADNERFDSRGERPLRTAVVFRLRVGSFPQGTAPAQNRPPKEISFRVITYNIAAARNAGIDDIAAVLDSLRADAIALQEVASNWEEVSAGVDQAEDLGRRLGMESFSAPIYTVQDTTGVRRFGLAVLTKRPIIRSENHHITRLSTQDAEPVPRMMPGFPEVAVRIDGAEVTIFNTHLDFRQDPSVRRQQVEDMLAIIGSDEETVLLVGDLNARPDAPEIQPLFARFLDSWEGSEPGFTGPVNNPDRRIDYILHSRNCAVQDVFVHRARTSDHFPVVADLTCTQ